MGIFLIFYRLRLDLSIRLYLVESMLDREDGGVMSGGI